MDTHALGLYWRNHSGSQFLAGSALFLLGMFVLKDSQLFLPSLTEYANTPLIGALPMALGALAAITIWSPIPDYDELVSAQARKVRIIHPVAITIIAVLVAFTTASIVFQSIEAGLIYSRLLLYWLGLAFIGTALPMRQLVVLLPLAVFLIITFNGYTQQGPRIFNPHHRKITDPTAWTLTLTSITIGLAAITAKLRRT